MYPLKPPIVITEFPLVTMAWAARGSGSLSPEKKNVFHVNL